MSWTPTHGQLAALAGTETDLITGNTYDSGTLQTTTEKLSVQAVGAAIVEGEAFRVRVYHKVNGTVRVLYEEFIPAGGVALEFSDLPVSSAGWAVTGVRTSGSTARDVDFFLFRETELTAAAIRDAILDYAHETSRTVRGVIRRLDALMTGKATGLLGVLATFYRADGVTKVIEATQDTTLGTRETASTVGGD